ncbi:MAG: hypothetical protein K9N23_21950, partial [Akkermansiaceae bacterium]|nr:hypothetical protein [Akkermansiaceae bacterium]
MFQRKIQRPLTAGWNPVLIVPVFRLAVKMDGLSIIRSRRSLVAGPDTADFCTAAWQATERWLQPACLGGARIFSFSDPSL